MSKDARQSMNHRHTRIQKRRSASLRLARGLRRCRTNSCCRRQRFICDQQHLWSDSRSNRPHQTAKHSPLPLLSDGKRLRSMLSIRKALRITILRPSAQKSIRDIMRPADRRDGGLQARVLRSPSTLSALMRHTCRRRTGRTLSNRTMRPVGRKNGSRTSCDLLINVRYCDDLSSLSALMRRTRCRRAGRRLSDRTIRTPAFEIADILGQDVLEMAT
jgi:hypothetical protein